MELIKEETTVATDEVQSTERISERIERALSGSKSGPVKVVSEITYNGTVDRLHQYLVDQVV